MKIAKYNIDDGHNFSSTLDHILYNMATFFFFEVINQIDEIIMIFTRITIDKNQMTIFFKLIYIHIYKFTN